MRNRTVEYDKRNASRLEWIEAGYCRDCGNRSVVKSRFCAMCYLIRISAKRLGSGKYWKELMTLLEEQNNTCALSGLPIRLGEEIELDHIYPVSKGGSKSLDNVHWVLKSVNRMKHDMTIGDFKIMCQIITNHLSDKRDRGFTAHV